MNISRIPWIVIILLLLLPTTVGRILINFAGGIFLIISLVTLVIAGLGWGGLKYIKSKMIICANCGTNYMKQSPSCPICGYQGSEPTEDLNNSETINRPASSVTIDIKPEETSTES